MPKRRIPLPLLSPLLFLCFFISIEDHPKKYLDTKKCFAADKPGEGDGPGSSHSQGSAEPTQNQKNNLEACETAHKDAVASVSGGMNMGEYAAVGQTANTALSAQNSGEGGASQAHLGSAAINGTLGAVSASRYMSCQSAISECEEKCGKDAGNFNDLTLEQQTQNKNNLKACIELSGKCSAAGMQSVLSLAQAAIGFATARRLRGGDPEDDTSPDKPPPTPPNPSSGNGGGPPGPNLRDASVPEGAPTPRRDNMPIPMLQTTNTKDKDVKDPKTDPKPTPGPNPNAIPDKEHLLTDGRENPLPLRGGKVSGLKGNKAKASSPSGAFSGNKMNNGMGRFARDKDKTRSSKNQDEAELIISGGGSSGFSGSDALSGNSLNGSMRGWGGRSSRKQASNKKKPRSSLLKKKSALAQSSGQHDSIFKKASALIKNYCNGGGAQCN